MAKPEIARPSKRRLLTSLHGGPISLRRVMEEWRIPEARARAWLRHYRIPYVRSQRREPKPAKEIDSDLDRPLNRLVRFHPKLACSLSEVDRLPEDPSQAEIVAMLKQIQSEWDPTTELIRRTGSGVEKRFAMCVTKHRVLGLDSGTQL